MTHAPAPPWIVIMGAAVRRGGRPSGALRRRVTAALDFARTLHGKAYLPEEEDVWEASWYSPDTPDFVPFPIGETEAGFLICTELWAMEHARGYAQENVSLLLTPRVTGATIGVSTRPGHTQLVRTPRWL